MSTIEKLEARIRNNPYNCTFTELEKLLIYKGFVLDRVRGSHHIYAKGSVVFVLPVHGKTVKSIYVKRALAAIDNPNLR